jgi:tol-pal system protein YbgF
MRSASSRPIAAALAGAALLASACAGGKRISSVEVDAARLADRVAELERQQSHLESTVDSLNALVRKQTTAVYDERAGRNVRADELERQISALTADLRAAELEIAELKDRQAFGVGAPAGPPGAGQGAPTEDASPRALYDAAYEDLMRGNHGLAVMGFQEVLEQYPTSQLADNALYWLGEAYYVQKDYKRALEHFRKVTDDYPKADKVPAAMLKVGFCEIELGRKSKARAALQELVKTYPNSEEAHLARDKLTELD